MEISLKPQLQASSGVILSFVPTDCQRGVVWFFFFSFFCFLSRWPQAFLMLLSPRVLSFLPAIVGWGFWGSSQIAEITQKHLSENWPWPRKGRRGWQGKIWKKLQRRVMDITRWGTEQQQKKNTLQWGKKIIKRLLTLDYIRKKS